MLFRVLRSCELAETTATGRYTKVITVKTLTAAASRVLFSAKTRIAAFSFRDSSARTLSA